MTGWTLRPSTFVTSAAVALAQSVGANPGTTGLGADAGFDVDVGFVMGLGVAVVFEPDLSAEAVEAGVPRSGSSLPSPKDENVEVMRAGTTLMKNQRPTARTASCPTSPTSRVADERFRGLRATGVSR
jgi:hypothetical protein